MLYLIPTPIGNLEDITLRALRILKEVDRVWAEDTRVARRLLDHFKIQTPVSSFHAFNEHSVTASIVQQIKAGATYALTSDAGTPGLSDPGGVLIEAVLAAANQLTLKIQTH